MANIPGTPMEDMLMGTAMDDVLWGGPGDDMLSGGDGDDHLIGGPGADVLDGGMGHDTASYVDSLQGVQVDLSGGMASTGGDAMGDSHTGIEELWGSRFADYLMGDRGMNRLFGRGGNDDLLGGGGDDLLRGGDGHDDLNGGAGMDVLYGDAGNDDLSGGSGDDVLRGGAGMDMLMGGSGMDVLEGGMGADMLNGGSGMDTASYAHSYDAVMVNLTTGEGEDGDADGDTYTDIENLRGSMGDDTLTGDDMGNMLFGQMGEDNLAGMGGDDTLHGGKDDDKLDGGMGDDTLLGEMGDDRLYGGDGIDKFVLMMGHGHDEIADFEKGVDKIKFGTEMLTMAEANAVLATKTTHAGQHTYTWEDVSVTVDVELEISDLYAEQPEPEPEPEPEQPPTRPTPVRITHTLTDGNDVWPSQRTDYNDGNETINALKGNDTVDGGLGDDMLNGGMGNDVLNGQMGHDDLNGNEGNDVLSGGDGSDVLMGGPGNDDLFGGSSWATTRGADGIPTVVAPPNDFNDADTRYNDTLDGGAGRDFLYGGAGNDVLTGGDGLDTLLGGAGDDTLHTSRDTGTDATLSPADEYANINGGTGVDTVSYADQKMGVTVILHNTTEATNIQSIENFIGSEGDDVVTQGDLPAAGTTDDPAVVLGSNFEGRGGNDMFTGVAGAVNHDGDADTPDVGRNDTVMGGAGKDTLNGGGGNDMLDGGSEDDTLTGGVGNDTIKGGSGNDTINGEEGEDILYGGSGNDTFMWGHEDVIKDFSSAGDEIDFGALTALPENLTIRNDVMDGKSGVLVIHDSTPGTPGGETWMFLEGLTESTLGVSDLL